MYTCQVFEKKNTRTIFPEHKHAILSRENFHFWRILSVIYKNIILVCQTYLFLRSYKDNAPGLSDDADDRDEAKPAIFFTFSSEVDYFSPCA